MLCAITNLTHTIAFVLLLLAFKAEEIEAKGVEKICPRSRS